jgi:hypothetical protein
LEELRKGIPAGYLETLEAISEVLKLIPAGRDSWLQLFCTVLVQCAPTKAQAGSFELLQQNRSPSAMVTSVLSLFVSQTPALEMNKV